MSIKVATLTWAHRGLDATAKLVLLRLADFAADDGANVFPTVDRVAEDTSLSERAVRTALRRLEEAGALVLVAREDSGRHRAREYRINLDFLARGTTCRAAPDAGRHEEPGGTTFQSGGHDVPERGAPDAPKPSSNHQRTVSRYAFEGRVIKLNVADFDQWRTTYHAIPDLNAKLTSIDAWFSSQPPEKRKGWFHSAARMLNKDHEEALAKRPANHGAPRPQASDWAQDGRY